MFKGKLVSPIEVHTADSISLFFLNLTYNTNNNGKSTRGFT